MGEDDSKRVTMSNGSQIEAKESSGEPLRGINPPLEKWYLFIGGPFDGTHNLIIKDSPVWYVNQTRPTFDPVATMEFDPDDVVVEHKYHHREICGQVIYVWEHFSPERTMQALLETYGEKHRKNKGISSLREMVHRLTCLLKNETRRDPRGPSVATEEALLLAESVMKKTLDL